MHVEGKCDYPDPLGAGQPGFDNISQSMYVSATAAPGSWTPVTGAGSPGTIISSLEPVEAGWLTGYSDGSMIPSEDGLWMYAYVAFYCSSAICDYKNMVARAPIHNLAPGNWMFWHNGCWCAPALNNGWNAATHLPDADFIAPAWIGGMAAATPGMPYKAIIADDGKDHTYSFPTNETYHGLSFSLTSDYVHFTTVHYPVVNYDFSNFVGRPTPDDFYLYAAFRDDVTGGSVLSPTHAAYWSIWVPPNNDLSKRYLVQWPVTISTLSKTELNAGVPQSAVSLETYVNAGAGKYRTTTVNPFASITSNGATETGWATSGFLGYIATACPNSLTINDCDATGAQAAVRIEECWSSATNDYQLGVDANGTAGSCPSTWTHVRTAGWLYKNPQSFGTNPVYSCFNSGSNYHFSSNDNLCNGQTVLGLLGYAMAN